MPRTLILFLSAILFSSPFTYPVWAVAAEGFATFSTRGHSAAKGLDFTIAYPRTWSASPGASSNTVQTFKRPSAKMFENLTVQVHTQFADRLPPETRSLPSTAKLFMDNLRVDDELLSAMYPSPARIIASKRLQLDGQEALQLRVQKRQVSAGVVVNLFIYETLVYHGGYLITFRFGFVDQSTSSSSMQQLKFEESLSLYDQLLDAAVLPAQKSFSPPETSSSVSQKPDGWSKVEIPNVCSFTIPPNMEVRGGQYKEVHDEFTDLASRVYNLKLSPQKLVIQPKGMNQLSKSSFTSYGRIIFKTTKGKAGEFTRRTTPLDFTATQLRDISDAFQSQLKASPHTKLLNWYPPTVKHFRGADALALRYRREGPLSPVLINVFMVDDFDKSYDFTFSYRESEKDTWEPLFKKVIDSIRFTEP
jgi:hypothetical protein